MPDSNGNFRGISVPDLPWKRVSWTQKANEDGTITRTYHHESGDEQVILDPRKRVEKP